MRVHRVGALGAAIAASALICACGSGAGTGAGSATTAASATPAASTSAATAGSSGPVALAGRSTSVAVNPLAREVLTQSGVTLAPLAPATASAEAMTFPITGGTIVPATFAGRIESGGGVALTHAGRSVQITGFVIDTVARVLTAEVAGRRVPIFAVGTEGVTHAAGPGGALVLGGLSLTVTPQAAAAMNAALGVKIFAGGLPFGVTTVTAVPGHSA